MPVAPSAERWGTPGPSGQHSPRAAPPGAGPSVPTRLGAGSGDPPPGPPPAPRAPPCSRPRAALCGNLTLLTVGSCSSPDRRQRIKASGLVPEGSDRCSPPLLCSTPFIPLANACPVLPARGGREHPLLGWAAPSPPQPGSLDVLGITLPRSVLSSGGSPSGLSLLLGLGSFCCCCSPSATREAACGWAACPRGRG